MTTLSNTVKGNIKDIVLKENYLAIESRERAESFSYALGALGLDVPGVWIKPVGPDVHKAFFEAYQTYKEARDAIMAITDESIDDSKAFMEISDFMGGSGIHHGGPPQGGPHGGPPQGGPHGGPPQGSGPRGGPPQAPQGGIRGGIVPRGQVNPLTKKPTDTVTISGRVYQQAQTQAISDLMVRVDQKITTLLQHHGKGGIEQKIRKRMDKILYQFLWDEFYKGIQASYLYLDVELMSCQEAIDFINHTIQQTSFEDRLKQAIVELKL